MPIDLDKKDGEYGKKCGTIYNRERNKYEYSCEENTRKYVARRVDYTECDLFEYIIHTELIRTSTTFLTFKSDILKINHQNFNFNDTHDLKNVKVYFPKSGKTNEPLVLVINTSKAYCYEFSYLKDLRNRKAINTSPRFGENQLLDKLIAENNTQNNVITYRIDKKTNGIDYDGVNVDVETHPSFEKYKHTPLKKAENTPAGYVLYKGHQIELESKPEYKGKDPKLTDIQKRPYTNVTVFFWKQVNKKPDPELPIFLVLQEKTTGAGGDGSSSINTYCLQRFDQTGFKWKQIDNPNLDTVITFLIDHKVDNGQSYNGSIDVKPQEHVSFNVYEHTPQGPHTNKKAYLLFNFEFLILQDTDFKGSPKLENLQLHNYCKLTVYFFKSERNNFNATIPIYLELETQAQDGGSTKYYLQRTDSQAIKWKQIKDPNLTNTITYLLEHKNIGPYNNDSVTVSKGNHVSFDVYTHKPQDQNKLGLLLYNYSLLVLDNTKLPDGVEKLDKLEFKNYCEISLYYFKLSNNGSHEIPTYIVLKIKDSSSKYYLERTGTTAIYWTQIKNPELEKVITFLLDKKTGSYNDSSVNVNNEPNPCFNIYCHKQNEKYADRKAYLRYNDKNLELESNDLIEENKKLNDFDGHVYCHVSLFYYNKTDEQRPTFLELRVKATSESEGQQDCASASNCYLLKIADKEGVKWKQIDYQNLRNTVTYQLEFKSDGQNYNNGSVTVSKSIKESFDVYTHTRKQPGKMGLLLYNWETLTLQPNYDLGETTPLKKLHGNKYCNINVYYSQTHNNQPPLFLELFENTISDTSSSSENCQCPDGTTGNCKCYWLQRVDPEGHHWKQVTKPDLGEQNAQEIFTQILSNNKNSIMVRLTERNWYDIKLIKNYRNDAIGILPGSIRQIEVSINRLQNSDYRYSSHTFVQSVVYSSLKIFNLRTFIGTSEIKYYKTDSKKHDLQYVPSANDRSKLYVYFRSDDTFPLLLCYDEKWFCPTLKNKYLNEWSEVDQFKGLNPSDSSTYKRIITKLDQINKQFNEILLHQTNPTGYGITPPPSGQTPSGFSLTRVTVNQTPQSTGQSFGKVTHSTKNGSSIGRVVLGNEELKDHSGNKLSEVSDLKSGTFIGVAAFYHKTDQSYKKPLLLGFTKSGGVRNTGNPEVFYERLDSTKTSKWKKIEGPDVLNPLKRGDQDQTAQRINTIHYNIGKSIVIRVDQQSTESGGTSDNYPVKLVDNKVAVSALTQAGGTSQITVSKGVNCGNPPPTGYTCFKHTIPSLTSSEYVSGLKLYICTSKYLETYTGTSSGTLAPIYYNPEKTEVKVYFYGTGTSGTSNTPVDKVPLLVEYNGTHYRPEGRDTYFDKWVQKDIPTGDGRGDTGGLPQIGKVLDEINRGLNTIELDKTGNGTGESYGLTKTGVSGTCNKTSVDDFCKRVTVTRNLSEGAGNYLKVTHATNNKGPIGEFMYNKDKISGIKVEGNNKNCNRVDVYYRTSDNKYETPLLICITTDSPETSSTCKKWFSRQGIDVKLWNNADNDDGKFNDDPSIRKELEKIQTNLSNYLLLDISKQGQYTGYVQKGSESSKKYSIGTIKASLDYGHSEYKPENYRFCKHQLHDYYSESKKQIGTTLELESHGTDLTLQVSIYLDSIYIDILGTSGDQPLSNPLIYGPTDARRGDSNDPFVYFYDPDTHSTGYGTDTVPLLFKYGNKYFGPNSKDDYFKKWKEVSITDGGQLAKNIKKELDRINAELNEIDLSKKGGHGDDPNYGIPDPGGGGLKGSFPTKRITVTQETLSDKKYTTISHTTTNGFNIGPIKALGTKCTFDNTHTQTLKTQSHNQVVAVYVGVGASVTSSNPSLVLICSSKGGLNSGSQVLGYYDLSKGDCTRGQYTFQKVKSGFTVDQLKDRDKVQESCSELVGILERIGIVKEEVQTRAQTLGQGSEQNLDEDQDDRPKVGLGPGGAHPHGGGGDARGGSAGMGAGTKAGSMGARGSDGQAGKDGSPGQTGARGDSGTQTEPGATRPGPSSDLSPTTITRGSQEHTSLGGGGHGRPDGGVAGPPGEPGAQSSSEGGGGIGEFFKNLHENKPEILYGGTGGAVGGVGVIGGVGAVVYKKCVAGSAVAATKAAAKVAASAASGM